MSHQAATNLPDLAGEQPEREQRAEQHHQADQTGQEGMVIGDHPIVHDAAESVRCRI